MPVKWDEANLQANAEEATAANRMQITEPKTPFHYLGDDGEPEAYPPKAAPATAAPREAKQAAKLQAKREAAAELEAMFSPDEQAVLREMTEEEAELFASWRPR